MPTCRPVSETTTCIITLQHLAVLITLYHCIVLKLTLHLPKPHGDYVADWQLPPVRLIRTYIAARLEWAYLLIVMMSEFIYAEYLR